MIVRIDESATVVAVGSVVTIQVQQSISRKIVSSIGCSGVIVLVLLVLFVQAVLCIAGVVAYK